MDTVFNASILCFSSQGCPWKPFHFYFWLSTKAYAVMLDVSQQLAIKRYHLSPNSQQIHNFNRYDMTDIRDHYKGGKIPCPALFLPPRPVSEQFPIDPPLLKSDCQWCNPLLLPFPFLRERASRQSGVRNPQVATGKITPA